MKKLLLATSILCSSLSLKATNISEGKLPLESGAGSQQSMTINDLPDELPVRIFKDPVLDSKDLNNLSLVSKRFRNIANEPLVRGERSFRLNGLISKSFTKINQYGEIVDRYGYHVNEHEAEKSRLKRVAKDRMDFLRQKAHMHAYISDHYKGNSELDRLVTVMNERNSDKSAVAIETFKIAIDKVRYKRVDPGTEYIHIDDEFFNKLTDLKPTHIRCNNAQLQFIAKKMAESEDIRQKYKDVEFFVLNHGFSDDDNVNFSIDENIRNQMIYMLASKGVKELLAGENKDNAYELINGFINKHFTSNNRVIVSCKSLKNILKNARFINKDHFNTVDEFINKYFGDNNKSYYFAQLAEVLFSKHREKIKNISAKLSELEIFVGQTYSQSFVSLIKVMSGLDDKKVDHIITSIKAIKNLSRASDKCKLFMVLAKESEAKIGAVIKAFDVMQIVSNYNSVAKILLQNSNPQKINTVAQIVRLAYVTYGYRVNKELIEKLSTVPDDKLTIAKANTAIYLFKQIFPNIRSKVDSDLLVKILKDFDIPANVNVSDIVNSVNAEHSKISYSYKDMKNYAPLLIDSALNGHKVLNIIEKFCGLNYSATDLEGIYKLIKSYHDLEKFNDAYIAKLKNACTKLGLRTDLKTLDYLLKVNDNNLSDENFKKINDITEKLSLIREKSGWRSAVELGDYSKRDLKLTLLGLSLDNMNDDYINSLKSYAQKVYSRVYNESEYSKETYVKNFLIKALYVAPSKIEKVWNACSSLTYKEKEYADFIENLAKLPDNLLEDKDYLERVKSVASSIRYIDTLNISDYYVNDIINKLLNIPVEVFNNKSFLSSVRTKYNNSGGDGIMRRITKAIDDVVREVKFSN